MRAQRAGAAQILDVREQAEWEQGHIPDSLSASPTTTWMSSPRASIPPARGGHVLRAAHCGRRQPDCSNVTARATSSTSSRAACRHVGSARLADRAAPRRQPPGITAGGLAAVPLGLCDRARCRPARRGGLGARGARARLRARPKRAGGHDGIARSRHGWGAIAGGLWGIAREGAGLLAPCRHVHGRRLCRHGRGHHRWRERRQRPAR